MIYRSAVGPYSSPKILYFIYSEESLIFVAMWIYASVSRTGELKILFASFRNFIGHMYILFLEINKCSSHNKDARQTNLNTHRYAILLIFTLQCHVGACIPLTGMKNKLHSRCV